MLYTSIDQPVAAPIIRDFEKQTGIHVVLVTDTEATKSVGLAERLRAEKSNPQADVWWGNEPFHTINLADEGVLAAYESPAARDIPEKFKDAAHRWTGNGARARVLVRRGTHTFWAPGSIESLLDPKLKGKIAIAAPTAGTTAGHIAAMFVVWGDQRAEAFLHKLHDNGCKLLGGNSVVADSVAAGSMLMGLCDNDDASAARSEGGEIEISLLVPVPDGLLIPTTVGLVTHAKHEDAARQLIDYLVSAEVEQELIDAKFAYDAVRRDPWRAYADIDYRAVAKKMPEAVRRATAILEGRQ